ncbi:MAG: hypothetical protein A2Y38_04585 [Spirochaetes bacterium GWB1_59_5]|nr:MAG: hypothetical protein A2Y38_04585 [Spirochaetes bacterium GWB1_59_5]
MTVASYLRVSTVEQERDGYGLDVQRERILGHCISRGWDGPHGDDEYIDVESGTIGERPGLQRLLADCRSGKVKTVVCARVDRVARNTALFLRLAAELDEAGVVLIASDQPLDMSTPVGRFVVRLLASLAELDRDQIVGRLTDGKTAKKKVGGWTGGPPPFGYMIDGRTRELAKAPVHGEQVATFFALMDEGAQASKAGEASGLGSPLGRHLARKRWFYDGFMDQERSVVGRHPALSVAGRRA